MAFYLGPGLWHQLPHPAFFMDAGNLDSGSCADAINVLPSLQLNFAFISRDTHLMDNEINSYYKII